MPHENHEVPPPIETLQLPRDAEGPVFAAPWEGQAFALAVALRDSAMLSWPEFVAYLADEIAAAGPEEDGSGYYRHWLRAVERALLDKQLLTFEELSGCRAELAAARRGEHRHHDARQAS